MLEVAVGNANMGRSVVKVGENIWEFGVPGEWFACE